MRVPLPTYGSILAVMWFPLDTYAASEERFIPDCAGRVEIAHAHVLRVDPNGAMILPDGRALLLEGIRLPDTGPLADQTVTALRSLTGASTVTFTTASPKDDRYGRIRVQGFGRQWLQAALLEQGLARVSISPDRDECAPDLYEAEYRARTQRLGIWALASYRVRTPEEMKDTVGSFQLVEGRVTSVGQADGRQFIDFGNRRIFSAVIAPQDRRAFRDFDFEGLSQRRIRLRGIVQDYRGRPEIALSNPYQIEVLD